MSSTNILVNPKQIIKAYTIDNIDIRVNNLDLGNSVDLNVVIKNNGSLLDVKNFHIEGEEYNKWGQSDSYLENLILSKLELTRKE